MVERLPVGFERWEPGAPWGDVVYSDGSRTPVPDEDGSIEAEVRSFGARQNAQPAPAPTPGAEAPLTGAASGVAPVPPPEAPPPPPPPPRPAPMPATAPLSAAEKAPLVPTTAETAALGRAPPGQPGAAAAPPATPAAEVLAEHGLVPPPAAAPAQAGLLPARNPAEETIRALAPGLLPSSASVQAQGPDAQSRANIEQVAGDALLLKGKAINQQTAGAGATLQDESAAANQAYFDAWKARNQALGDEAAAIRARDQASSMLSEAQARPITPRLDLPEWAVVATIFGAIAGGLAEGASMGRLKNTTMQSLNEVTRTWIETQKVNKSALVTDYERILGDKNAALAMAQSKIKNAMADEADSRKRFARSAAGMRELESTANMLRAQALDDYNKSQALVMGQVATNVGFARPAPAGRGGPNNPVVARLASLGYTPEEYTKGLNGKVREGENSPTIAMAATTAKQIESDINLLESLAAANNNSLPTKGIINVPQALIPTLSRLGYKPGMAADQTLALINTYVTQRAKSYGGVITEADREAATKEMGASGESFIGALRRLHTINNNGMRTALGQQFPGAGQKMLDILLSDTGSYSGIPLVETKPFEKQNVATTGPAGQSEDARRAKLREAELARGADPAVLDRAEELRKQDEEAEAAKRREREAEVGRRKPVERMKL